MVADEPHPIEAQLGLTFSNRKVLRQALTHPSYTGSYPKQPHYERLEFLGDAVLELVMSEWLYEHYPDEVEGHLAKRRAALVSGRTIAKVAKAMGLSEHIRMSKGELTGGGRENKANLENALEALIAAIYLDHGLDEARAFVAKHFVPIAQEMAEVPIDPKTALQEWAQAQGLPVPEYTTTKQDGPSHAPQFTVQVAVQGYKKHSATGRTKRAAEKLAAKALLDSV